MTKDIKKLADECLGCIKKPCQSGCPLNNDTTGFIELIKEEKYKDAYNLLCNSTVLSPICGRICPHEKQCMGSCVKKIKSEAVQIGKLEAFIGDLSLENGWNMPKLSKKINNKKIAIVGGGPSGLSCAAFLSRNGFKDITIYEKREKLRRYYAVWNS